MSPFQQIMLYVAWAILWAGVQVLALLPTGFRLEHTVSDALLYNVLLAAGGYAVGIGLRYYQPKLQQWGYLLGWSMGLAGVCLLLYSLLIGKIIEYDAAYVAFVDATLPVRMAFGWLMLLLILLLNWLWFYTRQQKQEEERIAATDKMAREAELYTLRQQLQPHFLFNSLNSISALVVVKPEQARTMVQQLSDFLRGTIRKENHQLVTLADELQQLQLYLEIEKVRFGHRLQTEVEVQDEARTMQLPALLLQPLVENAIKFGLYGTTGDTTIKVQAKTAGHYLSILIQNPYDHDTMRTQEGTGFGLSSVQRRLYLLYARHDLVQTQQLDGQFLTTLKIPQNYDQMPDNR